MQNLKFGVWIVPQSSVCNLFKTGLIEKIEETYTNEAEFGNKPSHPVNVCCITLVERVHILFRCFTA